MQRVVLPLTLIIFSSVYSKHLNSHNFFKWNVETLQTPDGVILKTDEQKIKAAYTLKRKGYKAEPLRRIHITKKIGARNWCFFTRVITKTGKKCYTLIKAADTKIRRHIKIKGEATPFNGDYNDYFIAREDRLRRERILSRIVNNSLKRA